MNWDRLIELMFSNAAAVILAFATLIASIANFIQATKTHKSVNGMKTELIESKVLEATATATLAEKKAENVRKGEAAITKAATLEETNIK